jgi:hypothetical protein
MAFLATGCLFAWGVRAQRQSRSLVVLSALVLSWVVLKVVYVQFHIPARNVRRAVRESAGVVAREVPAGKTLYLVNLRGLGRGEQFMEGILFYYKRPVLALQDWTQLPNHSQPVYFISRKNKWRRQQEEGKWRVLRQNEMKDQHGNDVVLVGAVRK